MEKRMECPECGAKINPAAEMGKKGGQKSRRVLTTEQSKDMLEARRKKREQLIPNKES